MIRQFSAVAIVSCLFSVAQAQPPSLGVAVPSAVQPGKPTDVTFYGGNLIGPVGTWLSFAGQIEPTPEIEGNGSKADQVTYRITVPAEASLEIGAVRLATAHGVSNLRLLMVDDLATVNDNGNNKTLETAQELTLPIAVDGASEPESFDFYKFSAQAGQRISVEVFARRLGFPLDPVIRLIDSAGKELAYSDDEGGTSADCRFAYQFEADGTYFIEIRDIRYQGGGGHRYRMRVGDFPLVAVPSPMGARKGATTKIEAAGPAVMRAEAVQVVVPAQSAAKSQAVTFKNHDGQGSAFATLVVSEASELTEFEPNDTPGQATAMVLPAAMNGMCAAPKDRDYYQFDVQAGQRFVFIGRTRRQGSPADLYLRLFKADGGLLAEVDDVGTEEAILNQTFAEAGTYRLMVEDLNRSGGPAYGYRIEAMAYQPGFDLVLETDKFDVPRGGVFVAKVTSRRFDYNGPINMALTNADGFQVANTVIAEGQNEVVLQVTAPENLEPGQWRNITVIGSAKIGDTDFQRTAGTLEALKGQFSGLPYPPEALNGIAAFGVGPAFADFFKLTAEPVVRFPQLVGSTTITVKAEKLNGFTDAIALSVVGLPPEFSVEAKPIEKDKAESQITIKGPLTSAESDHPFRVVGNATFQNQPKSAAVESLVLQVRPPLGVAVEFAGPVAAGAPLKAKIRATRDGEAKGVINLSWKHLPVGVSAPENLTIAEGQTEVEVELETAPTAVLGAASDVTVVATTQVQGKTIEVESPRSTLEITMP